MIFKFMNLVLLFRSQLIEKFITFNILFALRYVNGVDILTSI